jgi:hypothetical protein
MPPVHNTVNRTELSFNRVTGFMALLRRLMDAGHHARRRRAAP